MACLQTASFRMSSIVAPGSPRRLSMYLPRQQRVVSPLVSGLRLRAQHNRALAACGGLCSSKRRLVGARCSAAALTALPDNLPETVRLPEVPADTPLPPPPANGSLKVVLPYLWRVACADRSLQPRLAGAFICLILAKCLGLTQPLMFKHAVDALAAGGPGSADVAARALLLAGAARALSGLFAELRSISFLPVAQSSARRVALTAFRHVLSLDLQFHLARQTGTLSRTIERGTRSVAMVFRAVVFTFIPTLFELAAVCFLLWRAFSPAFVACVLVTFTAYTVWTVALTQLSAERRTEANRLDGEASGKAVDALLNYETVATFGNVLLESGNYDGLLKRYHGAAVHAEAASCWLNAGQAVTLAAGLAVMLAGAAWGWGGSAGTVGDLVMANGLLIQLWAPLNFLGFFYRELRQRRGSPRPRAGRLLRQPTSERGPLSFDVDEH